MQKKRVSGLKGFITGGTLEMRDAEQKILGRKLGQVGCRTGWMQDRWYAGQVVCRTGCMQERRDAGKEGFKTGGIQGFRTRGI